MEFGVTNLDGSTSRYTAYIDSRQGKEVVVVEGELGNSPRIFDLLSDGCLKCSHPGIVPFSSECSTCSAWIALERVVAMGEYVRGGKSLLSEDIHAAKYENIETYAQVIGVALGVFINKKHSDLLEFDFIMPSPWFERVPDEYHHEPIITKSFCEVICKLYRDDDVLYSSLAGKMVRKSREKRWNLAQEKIHARNVDISGCSVLLVDDILTTGNTLDRCASELKRVGATKVAGVVAARTGNE